LPIFANTCYSQPDKKSPSFYALATENNFNPFTAYLDQQYHAVALALNTPIPMTLREVLSSTEGLAAMQNDVLPCWTNVVSGGDEHQAYYKPPLRAQQ